MISRRSFWMKGLFQTKINPPRIRGFFGSTVLNGIIAIALPNGTFQYSSPLPNNVAHNIRVFRNGLLLDDSDYSRSGTILTPTITWNIDDKVEVWIFCE